MNRIVFLILCSVAIVFAQQAEQNLPQVPPQPQVQAPQPQPQPPLQQQELQQFQPQVQVVQQPPQPQVQLPPLQAQPSQQQTGCPKPLPRPSYGLQARFNINSVTYGFLSKKNHNIDMGIGFGFGVIRSIPLTNSLYVNPEITFIQRNLYSTKGNGKEPYNGNMTEYDYWEDENEFVMTIIPVLIQFTPFEFPLYVAAGFQADFPFNPKLTITKEYKDGTEDESTKKYNDRAGYDLGMVLGIGYDITERFSINLRSVVGLTSVTGKSKDAHSPIQYGIGVTFF